MPYWSRISWIVPQSEVGNISEFGETIPVRGVETQDEIPAISDLIGESFDLQPGMGIAYGRIYRSLMEGGTGITPDCSRVCQVEREIVGHALVIPRVMSVCGIPIPAAIVAFVVVRKDYRSRGIGTALVQDGIARTQERGGLISHLSGDPAFYRRFGYVEACCRNLGRMSPPGQEISDLTVRVARPEDAGTLSTLFNLEHGHRTACIQRETAEWIWQLEIGHPLSYASCNQRIIGFLPERETCLIAEVRGEITGYVRFFSGCGRTHIHEGAVIDDRTASALLGRVGETAKTLNSEEIVLSIPSDTSLGTQSLNLGAEFEETLDPELLIKIIDAPELMNRLAHVFTERVRGSALYGESANLIIVTERDRIELRIRPGGVSTGKLHEECDWRVTLPEIGLVQMVFGTRDYASLIGGEPDADSKLREWISVLFPLQHPFVYLGDTF